MPKQPKRRTIYSYPNHWSFIPENEEDMSGMTELFLDEYESVRLIDWEGLTQEEAAIRMGVARTTVTAIYERARKKLADMLVNGRRLRISGGNIALLHREYESLSGLSKKGSGIMRIAVTYDKGEIFQHFGHTEEFKLYDIESKDVKDSRVVSTEGEGHGALAGFLKSAGVDELICGGIGGGAINALTEAGIRIYAGVSGSADEAVSKLLKNELEYTQDANCSHHEHGEGHNCGSHHHGEEHHGCHGHGEEHHGCHSH